MGQRKYPPLTGSEIGAILIALGFKKVRTESSHEHYECPAGNGYPRSVVTLDTNYRDFDESRIKTMIRQSNRPRDAFYGATKGTARKASVPHLRINAPAPDPE